VIVGRRAASRADRLLVLPQGLLMLTSGKPSGVLARRDFINVTT
jgi:hypothetical protein